MAETEKRNARKVVTGTVVSISGDKSITVKIDYRKRHPKYGIHLNTFNSSGSGAGCPE